MQESLGKNLCQCILKQGLILKQSNQNRDRFQLMVQDLIGCFPAYKNTDKYTVTNLKKKIGKMLSIRSRILKIPQQELKNIKILVFQIINKKINIRQMLKIHKRKLVIGKNREIYSSSDQSQTIKQHYITQTYKKQQQQSQQFQYVIKQDQYQQKQQQEQYQQQQTCSIVNITPKKRKIIKRKYNCYDHDFKQEVCQYAAEKGIEATNKKYQLSIRKITSWLQAYKLNILGKGRKALDPAMEFNMSIWILQKIWNRIPLTQKIIRQKAATMKTIANAFNGSKGWLQKFFLRHVQIKSCFDFRNKIQTQEQCARYHRSAYYRMLQDYQTLKKLQCHSPIVQEDFQQIIYGNKTNPLLRTHEDGNLQKLKISIQPLYDYEKVLNMSSVPFSGRKKVKIQHKYEEDQDEIQNQNSQSQEQYQNSSDEDNDNMSEKIVKYEESDQQSQKPVSIFEEDSDMDKDQQVKAQELLV